MTNTIRAPWWLWCLLTKSRNMMRHAFLAHSIVHTLIFDMPKLQTVRALLDFEIWKTAHPFTEQSNKLRMFHRVKYRLNAVNYCVCMLYMPRCDLTLYIVCMVNESNDSHALSRSSFDCNSCDELKLPMITIFSRNGKLEFATSVCVSLSLLLHDWWSVALNWIYGSSSNTLIVSLDDECCNARHGDTTEDFWRE